MTHQATAEVTLEPPVPATPTARLAAAGVALITLCVPLMGLLHLLPPSNRVNPLTRTISEYALGGNGWLFDVAVLALATGSAAVILALVRARVLAAAGPAGLLLMLWSIGLAVLVVFEKHDWAAGPSVGGHVHRAASLVAFMSLPAGALLAARAGRSRPTWRVPAAVTRWTAVAAVAALTPLFYAIGVNLVTGRSWWRVFPLGAVERVVGLADVMVMLALGVWALRAHRGAPAPT